MSKPRTHAEKLEDAKAHLKKRGLYIIDSNALAGKRPSWGIPGEIPQQPNAAFMERMIDADRRGQPATFLGGLLKAIRSAA